MTLGEKMKLVLAVAEMTFRLPNDEAAKLHDLVEQRVRKHGALYGASMNSKTGTTAEKIKGELRKNADALRGWADEQPDQTAEQEFLL